MTKPLVIHPNSRNIFLLESLDKNYEVSQQLIEYADLIQAPEQVHTYNLTPYALWTAKAKKIGAEEVIIFLERNLQNVLSESLKEAIKKDMGHFGSLEFSIDEEKLILKSKTEELVIRIKEIDGIKGMILHTPSPTSLVFKLRYRKEIKKILFEHNLFVKDIICEFGKELDIKCTFSELLDYQAAAVNAYLAYNHQAGGGGTIIMPPNSGKIIVGLKIIEELKTSTLVIVEDKYKVDKWKNEIMEKTDLSASNIAIFDQGGTPLKPITIGTYNNISAHVDQLKGFGLVIYDDAHNLPTPIHEKTVDLQAKNKLALASTLARSDGNGNLVLALIGPKWYEVLYPTLVNRHHQVPVKCVEVKIPLPDDEWKDYLQRDIQRKVNPDTLNSNKSIVASILLKKEITKRVLIVSYFKEAISKFSDSLDVERLTSKLNEENRQRLIESFNNKEIDKLVTPSKLIENMTLNMVDVIIALSHQHGSEREEYLRLGKLLPAGDGKNEAVLYSLVSKNTDEERYYAKRRRKLINYGFHYKILLYQSLIEKGEFYES
ncbi:helicase-associated domain-containing protein [Cytobacillus firmus]|uniref:helicase-associated domain-containing protein n=1 Tax=Cytobacillus firmus TaxID=1399 RepID=UPI002161A34C|nr:helicase-associated domain-containing protein [Cytobacillus firmus]MCS0674632.1 helicase-associated domain-containing protein [Cytobacillus firmus]